MSYDLVDGCLNIEHTIVPREIEGRGIAAALVKAAYDYALDHDLLPARHAGMRQSGWIGILNTKIRFRL